MTVTIREAMATDLVVTQLPPAKPGGPGAPQERKGNQTDPEVGVPGRHNREVQQGEEDVVRRAAAVGNCGVREGGREEDRRSQRRA